MVGWGVAGPLGAAVVLIAAFVSARSSRFVFGYAAVLLAAAGLATLLEAPLGDGRRIQTFVSVRPVSSTLGLGAGLSLIGALSVAMSVERDRPVAPVPSTSPGDGQRSRLEGLGVFCLGSGAMLAVADVAHWWTSCLALCAIGAGSIIRSGRLAR